MNFEYKKALVCGLARSGQAAAGLLSDLGAKVTAQDLRAHIDWTFDPKSRGISTYLGKNPDAIIGEFDLVVISPGISIYLPFVAKAKAMGIPVWGESELAFRLCPCPVVAITGTNGKTTVTTLVGEILSRHNPKTVVAGNIGVPLTSMVGELSADSIVVAEISSFQLETAVDFKPNVSAVLNMTPDHLDRHKDMETYIEMKSRIFANQRHPDMTVLNYDNEITRAMKPDCRVVWFSEKVVLPVGVYVQDGYICARLSENDAERYITQLEGLNIMAENALAATALALCAGASVEDVAQGLRAFKAVAHRLEHVASIDGVDYYNDSKATNVGAAFKALDSFQRPVVLIAGGSDKDADFAPWVQSFHGKVTNVILIGQTANQIADVCRANGFANYRHADTMQDAVEQAASLAQPGQAVLLSPACASFGMFKDFEDRGEVFRQAVLGLGRVR